MPKVSVVVPIYNVEKYIERCARSLFEQTLDDIEYIFIDDCSPDKSIKILNKILEEYPNRIPQTKIVRLEKNVGAANVRKQGIFLATGEYIIQCDSDDWVEKDMYKLMYCVAKERNSDVVICDLYRYDIRQKMTNYNKQLCYISVILGDINSELWNKLIKRELFYKEIVYPKSHLAEDLAILTQIFYFCANIGYVNKALYHYCYNENAITKAITKENIVRNLNQHIDNVNLIFGFFKREHLKLPKYVSDVLKWRCRVVVKPILNTNFGYKLWKNTYPEISMTFIFHKEIPFKKKIYFLLCYFRLLPIINILKKYC